MPEPLIVLPPGLDEQRGLGPDWARWLDGLPRRFRDVLDDWALRRDGDDLWHGFCSLVAPVLTDDGTRAVLKVAFDEDDESLHEALALQQWQGRGTVRLLRADPHRRAMLLERLERRDLRELEESEACAVVASLYAEIHVPAPPQLAELASFVGRWLDDLAAQPRDIPIPSRYREQALSLGRDLLADHPAAGRMIHGDLHYENVLAAPADTEPERGAWLVIDPKPMSGDPHYEPAPMLWNRYDELAGDVRAGLRRRFHALVDGAGLDEDRARDWVVVRMVLNANWSVQDAQRAGRDLDAEEREWITRCIAISKAVQD
ncbi:MAG TPA: aminoglycoside phosphotransferase family protein [Nocardioides sp.]|jgi:streptomycin 6-kinase|uniref:aminoglycoside phosphotransferase family protein n=1 Tax=Nocardioides sp. TaxID=35761 RepID=UPI002E2F3CC9|nr:aminoglycoside phosphotransferase family protein [Nocardioides sp.]HEX3930723.1 aminoglycoside phosphotransferase family protein [Nocardioides sp.]